ncbi:MAG: glycosyltransferase family 2 protein [Acidobacteria bacterium]|nr:glycosyltransferase family 2 protein [Acidobacteriota bacterium]
MPPISKVFVICINWNGRDVLGPALQSVLANDHPNTYLLVVDNGSTDNSLDEVPPGIEILSLPQNKGYAAAINRALESAVAVGENPDYFLIINNDICLSPTCISELAGLAEQAPPGVYGPKILNSSRPDRLDAAWGKITWSHVLARFYGKAAKDAPKWNIARKVPLLLGSALLIHRDVISEVGAMDESFFMYHEEVDFLYRCRKKGFSVYYCPTAVAWHRGAHSTRENPLQRVFWTRRNSVLFLRKHRAGPLQWLYFGLTLAGSLLFNIARLKWRKSSVIWQALRAGFTTPLADS